MQVWHVLHAARWKYRTQKSPKNRHLRTIAQFCGAISSQLRRVPTIGKNWLNSNISPTCAHNMVNFGRLAAEIGSVVLGTPANLNGFRVLASLLQRRRSTKANQTLHDVWLSPGLVTKYIYTFWGPCPITEFCQVQNSPSEVLRSPILAALPHGTRVVSVRQTLRRCAESATCIRQGGYHVGHWRTF